METPHKNNSFRERLRIRRNSLHGQWRDEPLVFPTNQPSPEPPKPAKHVNHCECGQEKPVYQLHCGDCMSMASKKLKPRTIDQRVSDAQPKDDSTVWSSATWEEP